MTHSYLQGESQVYVFHLLVEVGFPPFYERRFLELHLALVTLHMLFRTKLAEFHCIPDVTDFVLVAIHTSPSKAPQEINELANVYDDVIKRLSITDVIILGDLNAACSYMSDNDWRTNRLANDKRFHWLISDCVDTSLAGGHCAYDRWVK